MSEVFRNDRGKWELHLDGDISATEADTLTELLGRALERIAQKAHEARARTVAVHMLVTHPEQAKHGFVEDAIGLAQFSAEAEVDTVSRAVEELAGLYAEGAFEDRQLPLEEVAS